METYELKGYKAFDKNMKNRYGQFFEVGKLYSTEGPIKFGISGNGYHFCLNLEDTLRYVASKEEVVNVAQITSLGEISKEYCDEYYGYYDMYVARDIRIDKILSRREIIEKYLDAQEEKVERFLKSYKLFSDEIALFKKNYSKNRKILTCISYYQEHNKDAYEIEFNKGKVKQKIYLR